jgi:hypothetical protein
MLSKDKHGFRTAVVLCYIPKKDAYVCLDILYHYTYTFQGNAWTGDRIVLAASMMILIPGN